MLDCEPQKRPSAVQLLTILGVIYIPRQIFSVLVNFQHYFPNYGRLRCFDLPWSLCYFVDNFIDHISYKLSTKQVTKPDQYDIKYDKCDPTQKYDFMIFTQSPISLLLMFLAKKWIYVVEFIM